MAYLVGLGLDGLLDGARAVGDGNRLRLGGLRMVSIDGWCYCNDGANYSVSVSTMGESSFLRAEG